MDSCPLRVDHVGILGASAADLAQLYRQLGFQVVGPAELEGVDEIGATYSLGQQSAHVMFGADYLELTSVSSADPNHHLANFLDSPGGLRLIILASDHIQKTQAHCAARGLNPSEPATAARKVTYGSKEVAHFKWFGLPTGRYVEGLVGFVEHQSWSTIFQEAVSDHTNTAVGIDTILLRSDQIPERYQQLADGEGEPVTLRATSDEELAQWFQCDCSQLLPLAGLVLRVSSLDAARDALNAAGKPYLSASETICVAPAEAGGVGLIFRQQPR